MNDLLPVLSQPIKILGILCIFLDISGVKMFLQGASRVTWDEQRSYTKGSSSQVSHKNVDVYLDEPMILVSRGRGVD